MILHIPPSHEESTDDRQTTDIGLDFGFAVEMMDCCQLTLGHLSHARKRRPDQESNTGLDRNIGDGFALGDFNGS